MEGKLADILSRSDLIAQIDSFSDSFGIPISLADPKDIDCPLIHVNQSFLDMTGYTAEEVLGRNCRFLQGEDTDPSDLDALRKSISARKPFNTCILNYKKDGTKFNNLLYVDQLRLNEDDILVMGCQHEFVDAVESDILGHSELFYDLVSELGGHRRVSRTNLTFMSDAAFMRVRAYLARQRTMGFESFSAPTG